MAVLLVAGWLFAQSAPPGREAMQEAYRSWRETDPTLERDATSAGATLGARADKAAAAGARYFAARKNYLDSAAADARQKTSTVEPLNLAPDAARGTEAYLAAQTTNLGASISTIARDPDPAIQRLAQALERERTAIAAITAAAKDVRKTQEATVQASSSAEQERSQASELYQKLAASLSESAQIADQSGTAWANYYRALSDAARSVAAPATSKVPEPAPVIITNPTPAAARAVTPIPLSRYVGTWSYPTVDARFHGAQPASFEMVLQEENGRARGTLDARFRLLPGDTRNPVVHFTFEGAFESARTQKFTVTTSSGAHGTLELIPGPAFNLLEVNFDADEKPGMVRQANFLLVKK